MSFNSYGNSFQKQSPVVFNLIIINVLVYLAQKIIGDSVTDNIALYPINSDFFKPHQVITHMFAHSPTLLVHIIFNMLGLWMFGSILERSWGPKRFLIFYLLSGLGAAALHLGVQYFRNPEAGHFTQAMYDQAIAVEGYIPKYAIGGAAVGASGAIMGVFAGFAYLFPNTPLYVMLIPIPIKAKIAIPIMVAIDLFGGFAGIPGDNIAHFAHLGGAAVGLLIVLYWNKTNKRTFY